MEGVSGDDVGHVYFLGFVCIHSYRCVLINPGSPRVYNGCRWPLRAESIAISMTAGRGMTGLTTCLVVWTSLERRSTNGG